MKVARDSVDPNEPSEVWPLLVYGGCDGLGRGGAIRDVSVFGEVEHPAR